uniref:Uncharacterized protein n=1 Tax=Trichogramma kaykai TaxID=54128 RepID=A0ABD2W387_9HYME
MTKESTWVPSPTENSNNPEKKIEEDKTKDTQDVESETGQSEMSETVYIQVSSLNETLQKQTETLKVLAETMKEIRADLKNQQQRTESMTSSFLEFARDQTKCQDANAVQKQNLAPKRNFSEYKLTSKSNFALWLDLLQSELESFSLKYLIDEKCEEESERKGRSTMQGQIRPHQILAEMTTGNRTDNGQSTTSKQSTRGTTRESTEGTTTEQIIAAQKPRMLNIATDATTESQDTGHSIVLSPPTTNGTVTYATMYVITKERTAPTQCEEGLRNIKFKEDITECEICIRAEMEKLPFLNQRENFIYRAQAEKLQSEIEEKRDVDTYANIAATCKDPVSYREAMRSTESTEWQRAIDEELKSMEGNEISLETKTPTEEGSVVRASLAFHRGQYFTAKPPLRQRLDSLY